MEGILWIIFLIIINNIFGKKKTGTAARKPQLPQPQRKSKPAARGIEDYFKEIAQKVQEQYQLETQPPVGEMQEEVFQPAREGESVKAKSFVKKQQSVKSDAVSMAAAAPFEHDESHPIYGKSRISSGSGLFDKREDIARGIIYSEILSKPLSMRKRN
ncbi:MAG: hypothetical protein GT589_09390 [Peptoclostridium sp.]|uniref:hypothetical protein n=1 Tax=Peptoclostridium sp. TaxID=1904860 RepID=UPI00139D3079|nr:hypothetical protein [Peptoclostridium sp.]MZQ76348.1 hypothetical protein [Peptoclostridium sp.]